MRDKGTERLRNTAHTETEEGQGVWAQRWSRYLRLWMISSFTTKQDTKLPGKRQCQRLRNI